jgi:hypothetical protein
MIATILALIKKNWIIALVVFAVIVFMIFPRQFKRLFSSPRRHHRKRVTVKQSITRIRSKTKSGKPIPRSAGRRPGGSNKGYPAAGGGYIPFKYNKDGSVKKAWQVGGTIAAKNRMSKLRRAR